MKHDKALAALKTFQMIIDKLCIFGAILAAFFVGIIAFIIFIEVFTRYVIRSPIGFSVEIVGYLTISVAFIGSAYALKENRHVNVDTLVRRLSPTKQKALMLIFDIVCIVFCVVFTCKASELVMHSIELKRVSITPLAVPIFIPQLSLVLGGALLILQFVKRSIENVLFLLNKPNRQNSHG